jgi:hypothetical protein
MTLSEAIAAHAHGADPRLLLRTTGEQMEMILMPLRTQAHREQWERGYRV